MPTFEVEIFPDGSGEVRILDENDRTVKTLTHPNMAEARQSIRQAQAEGLSYSEFRWFRDHPRNEQ